MDRQKTKLICNMNHDDVFLHPKAEGKWRNTGWKVKLKEGTYYECRRIDGDEVDQVLGTVRVTLAEGQA